MRRGVAFAVLVLAVPGYVLVPMPEPVQEALYLGIAAGGLLLGFLGLRHHRPRLRRAWLLVLLGGAGWVAGDVIWTIEQYLLPTQHPAPSDAVYLGSYLALAAGSLIIVRNRAGGRDFPAVLDAAIITIGAGVVVGVFLIAPLTEAAGIPYPVRAVDAAYPLADLFLLGVLARMYAVPGAQTASYRLLALALVLALTGDIGYEITALTGGDITGTTWSDGAWLAGYLLFGAAASVPSMRDLAEPDPE